MILFRFEFYSLKITPICNPEASPLPYIALIFTSMKNLPVAGRRFYWENENKLGGVDDGSPLHEIKVESVIV